MMGDLIEPADGDDVFGEILDWISQIEALTQTIRARLEEAKHSE